MSKHKDTGGGGTSQIPNNPKTTDSAKIPAKAPSIKIPAKAPSIPTGAPKGFPGNVTTRTEIPIRKNEEPV